MAFEIVWTPKAEKSFENIIRYLEKRWTKKEISKFVTKTDHILYLIAGHPKSFLRSEKKSIYKARVNEQNSLFYRVKKNQVELLLFWDGRQNPTKLEELLK